jgi:hypothetical protein
MRYLGSVRRFSPLVALALASACALFIPDNPSEPRHNIVLGDVRSPINNPGGTGAQQAAPAPARVSQAAPMPVVEAAPAPTPIATMDLPPVDPAVQRMAAQRIDDARNVPEENMTVAMGDYPSLHDVPKTAPASGDAKTAARLNEERLRLEQERAASEAAKAQLNRDAAAEPSLLSDMPAPPPAPVAPGPSSQRTVPVAPVAQAPVMALTIAAAPVLPPPPPMPVVATAAPIATGPAPIAMDSMPMGQPQPAVAAAPIRLQAPPAAPAPVSVASTGSGSFNPMASAESSAPITLTPPATYYASSQAYLPSSRYSSYRR